MSDNGPQMRSNDTREYLAICSIAQHFGRPGTPTDQAWVESLFAHVKGEYPWLTQTRDPRHCGWNLPRFASTTTRSAARVHRLRHPPRMSTKAEEKRSSRHESTV